MTGTELARLCKTQEGAAYIWGGLGHRITQGHIDKLSALYPKVFTKEYREKCQKNIGKLGYDCVGLAKHFLWGNAGDGILRHYEAATDVGADALYNFCVEKGKISALPELEGLLLHRSGHVGIYLGGGELVEARGIDHGVVISKLPARDFQNWGKLLGVEYRMGGGELSVSEVALLLKTHGIKSIRL